MIVFSCMENYSSIIITIVSTIAASPRTSNPKRKISVECVAIILNLVDHVSSRISALFNSPPAIVDAK